MKKIFCSIVFIFCFSVYSFSIGFTLGPFSNEQYLIENDGQFPVSFYDFPIFIGGIYHKINFSDRVFYYVDLAFDIHNSTLADGSSNGIDMKNYFIYFHNDINMFPFKQKWVYVGAGMELIVIDRVFSEPALQNTGYGYNYYFTANFFGYINMGITIPIKKVEIGFKTLYRLLPFSINNRMGNGEITFLIGLK